jgi:hypothetical protein
MKKSNFKGGPKFGGLTCFYKFKASFILSLLYRLEKGRIAQSQMG